MSNISAINRGGDEEVTCLTPIFREGCCPEDLLTQRMCVGVSIIPHHPCLLPSNNHKLVSFLMCLPAPSIIFLADTINSHNVKAMWKRGNKFPTDEKALGLAMEAARPLHEAISTGIRQLEEERPEKVGWVRLCHWADIEGEQMKVQQDIVRRHYEAGGPLKVRIDEIALLFLQYRRPMSKNHELRIPHMVNYLLAELPCLVAGVEMEGEHYTGILYPTTNTAIAKGGSLANIMFDLKHDIQTEEEFTNFRQEIRAATAAGCLGLPGVMLLPLEEAKITDSKEKKTNTEKAENNVIQEESSEIKDVANFEPEKTGQKMFRRQMSAGAA